MSICCCISAFFNMCGLLLLVDNKIVSLLNVIQLGKDFACRLNYLCV